MSDPKGWSIAKRGSMGIGGDDLSTGYRTSLYVE